MTCSLSTSSLSARRNGDGKRRTTKRRTANGELQNGETKQVRTEPPCLEDLECIDQLINEFFPIALSTEEDFARAIKAAYLTLELIDIHTQLLLSVARDLHEFSF
jgi:hypothetical protein